MTRTIKLYKVPDQGSTCTGCVFEPNDTMVGDYHCDKAKREFGCHSAIFTTVKPSDVEFEIEAPMEPMTENDLKARLKEYLAQVPDTNDEYYGTTQSIHEDVLTDFYTWLGIDL